MEQGEDLLRLKEQTPHGHFQARIEGETCLKYKTANRYMKLAREWEHRKSLVGETFLDLSIEAALGYGERQKSRPKLTREDAEYA